MRDSSCWIYGGVSINPMYWPARRREAYNMAVIYRAHPRFQDAAFEYWYPELGDDEKFKVEDFGQASLEGGDVEIIGKGTVAIGMSERTSGRMIERIAKTVAHRHYLNPDDCKEFVQIVHVRLFDDDYAILRKFEGRSSISTYLTTVIGRLYNEWRVAEWGKWRPSAEAKRLGDTAITLERLLTRDGLTFSEAVSLLTTRSGPHPSISELEAVYARLPPRNPRHHHPCDHHPHQEDNREQNVKLRPERIP
jgi:hypothetical protein